MLNFLFFFLLLANSNCQTAPFIGGTYKITVSYDEIRGDVGRPNACSGPFPYQLSWNLDIFQVRGSPTIRFCQTGTDCSEKYWDSVLVLASPLARQANCQFTPYSPVAGTDMKEFAVSPSCTKGLCIQNGIVKESIRPNCRYDKPCASNSRIDPQDSQLFAQFQLPSDSDQLVWARLCEVYAYQDTTGRGVNFRPREPHLKGAMRHVNETWVFILDPGSCSCLPDCASCTVNLPGSPLTTMNSTCLRDNGFGDGACKYMIAGVSGGVNIFPVNSTKVAPIPDDGEPRLCFQYATITGRSVREFGQMLVSHPEWQGSFALPTSSGTF